jgi:hypothetical protein
VLAGRWIQHPQLPGVPLSQRGNRHSVRASAVWGLRTAGPRGLTPRFQAVLVGFALFYPPYPLLVTLSCVITGCEEGLWSLRPQLPGIPLSQRGIRHSVRASAVWGAQRGEAPLRSFSSPKMEHPSQAEWGIKGVERLQIGNAPRATRTPAPGFGGQYSIQLSYRGMAYP